MRIKTLDNKLLRLEIAFLFFVGTAPSPMDARLMPTQPQAQHMINNQATS